MEPEAVIADFLMSAFTDEQLTVLRADAAAEQVPYSDADHCLLGHAGISHVEYVRSLPLTLRDTNQNISFAYNSLGDGSPWTDKARNDRRHRRLVVLCDAERARRAALRTEVINKAKSVALVTADQLVTVGR